MALTEDEHVVQALGSDGSDPALGDGVGSRRSEWRKLGQYQYCALDNGMWHRNSCRGHEREIVAAAIPSAAFDHLLRRP